jgi:hypothetical protein
MTKYAIAQPVQSQKEAMKMCRVWQLAGGSGECKTSSRGGGRCCAARIADDEVECEDNLFWCMVRMMDSLLHCADSGMAYRATWLMDSCQRHCKERGISHIIESHNTNIARHAHPHVGEGLNQLRRGLIIRADDCLGRI